MKRYITLPFILPGLLEGLLYVILANVLLLAKGISFNKEHWSFISTWRPWFGRRWHYATTLGHGIILHAEDIDPKSRLMQHEPIHVRQVDDLLFLSFILGLIFGIQAGSFWWFLGVWCSGIAWQLPNFLTAWLRGGDPYRDSEHERSAYAQSDRNTPAGRSWLDTHVV